MPKLFDYWRSSASYRVRIALGLAGLKWDTEIVNLMAADHQTPDHFSRNPQGFVPALWLDGQMFTQSLAMIEYLDETRHLGFLPSDPAERAHARALAYVIAMDIHPVCNLNVVHYAVENSNGAIKDQQWMQHFISKGLTAFENMVTDTPYCLGSKVTLPDICLMPQIYNANRWGVDLTEMPKIRRIAKALQYLSAFSNAHPNNAPQ